MHKREAGNDRMHFPNARLIGMLDEHGNLVPHNPQTLPARVLSMFHGYDRSGNQPQTAEAMGEGQGTCQLHPVGHTSTQSDSGNGDSGHPNRA
jgi:hypothetical protein